MSFASVIRIFATTQDPDYDCPWQACAPEQSTGSGVVVGKNIILTGAHVVANATFLQVRKQSDPVKVEARVLAICHDADLALLFVLGPHFTSTLEIAELGDLPELASKVSVVGFPIGGEELSITEGVVSRIEVQTFQHSGRRLLAVTVDAAINEGNSGGPVFQDKKVVGIAFQKLSGDTDNIGEMVPPMLLQRFLDEYGLCCSDSLKKEPKNITQDNMHRVQIPGLGMRVQKIENTCLRDSLGLHDNEGGLLVLGVEFSGSADGILQEGDVLLRLGEYDIAGNGTIKFAGRHRTQAVALLGAMRIGEFLDVKVLREGKRIQLKLELKPFQTLVKRKQYDVKPRFLVWGGLVLQPLSEDFLDTWNEWRRRAPTLLVHTFKSGVRTEKQLERVVLARILADESTAGYDDRELELIEEINGIQVRDLEHTAQLLAQAKERVTLKTHRGLIVLDVESAKKRQEIFEKRYQIPSSSRLHKRTTAVA